MANVKWKPEGIHTITPSFGVEGCAAAIEAYKKVFGAVEKERYPDPTGKKIWHAALTIGDSTLYLTDLFPEMGGPAKSGGQSFWLYVEDADGTFERAKAAGFEVRMPMADQFWGDRSGSVMDRWGNQWTIAKRVKEMTPEEIREAGEELARRQRR